MPLKSANDCAVPGSGKTQSMRNLPFDAGFLSHHLHKILITLEKV